jgi:thiol-disulfide isomerase/thioredoxin
MDALIPAVVLLGLVGLATLLGLVWRAQDGRVRRLAGGRVISTRELPKSTRFGRRATLLQFSTDVCAPCRTTHGVLEKVASEIDDVLHIDLNLTHRPDLASRFKIMQTPTTFILDSRGVVRARIGGAAKREAVQAELDRILINA